MKGRPIRKKELLKILLPIKNYNYSNLDNLSKLKFVGRYFYWVVTIFSKNRAILVQKLGKMKKFSKSLTGYFITKKLKIPTAIREDTHRKKSIFFSGRTTKGVGRPLINEENSPGSCIMKILFYEIRPWTTKPLV